MIENTRNYKVLFLGKITSVINLPNTKLFHIKKNPCHIAYLSNVNSREICLSP